MTYGLIMNIFNLLGKIPYKLMELDNMDEKRVKHKEIQSIETKLQIFNS